MQVIPLATSCDYPTIREHQNCLKTIHSLVEQGLIERLQLAATDESAFFFKVDHRSLRLQNRIQSWPEFSADQPPLSAPVKPISKLDHRENHRHSVKIQDHTQPRQRQT